VEEVFVQTQGDPTAGERAGQHDVLVGEDDDSVAVDGALDLDGLSRPVVAVDHDVEEARALREADQPTVRGT